MAPATVLTNHTSNSRSSERESGGKCLCGCWCSWIRAYFHIARLTGVKSHRQESYTPDFRHYSPLISPQTMSLSEL